MSVPVDPDTTSMIAFYPGATHAIKAGSGYSYFKLTTNLEMLGYGQPPPTEIRTKQIPPQVINQLPLTMGTTWTATYAESSYVTISGTTYTTLNNHVAENTVDAYGTLTLPGGAVYQALRLKTDRRSTSGTNSFRFISYQFLTKQGVSVNVSPSDTNQPQTGTISVSNISWSLPASATAVKEIPGGDVPSAFALEQNYPNPFNPSTTIQFSVSGELVREPEGVRHVGPRALDPRRGTARSREVLRGVGRIGVPERRLRLSLAVRRIRRIEETRPGPIEPQSAVNPDRKVILMPERRLFLFRDAQGSWGRSSRVSVRRRLKPDFNGATGSIRRCGIFRPQTSDSGYIVTGYSRGDVYLIRTNALGDTLWTRMYGGPSSDVACGRSTDLRRRIHRRRSHRIVRRRFLRSLPHQDGRRGRHALDADVRRLLG